MSYLSKKVKNNSAGEVLTNGLTRVLAGFSVMTLVSCATVNNRATVNQETVDKAARAKTARAKTAQAKTVQAKADSPLLLSKHQQLVLVISDNWQADKALLYRFDKKSAQWQQQGAHIQVTLGRTGLAWGIGLHKEQSGQVKKEGDGKAPAGIFTLGNAFGYLPQLNTALTYQKMTANDFCMDVNGSPYYNQIVSKLNVGEQGIKGSSEPMRRDIHLSGDDKYKKGLIVQHNNDNISGAGSCIFMHIWQAPTLATAGCTAMSETNITALLAWLNTTKQPLYVALPYSEYLAKKSAWALPHLPHLSN
jgi:L,D-peptidoglycan transpeptidase YkuD (ErfK/YbiS/YcfS/YnhG family)